ncbi:hypothetical protein [uncultured Sphaerochaeta sp.]|uniref:hypothetical protein n=1 Tax=uncultured Sphaerochaeta sp. TaxID=886478 RepID=UPI002A0A29BB|nr:hypothetical protein [uncultured Sphaerochaeta sp.]
MRNIRILLKRKWKKQRSSARFPFLIIQESRNQVSMRRKEVIPAMSDIRHQRSMADLEVLTS